MSFAEQKVELFKIVADADEETTGKLIEFAQNLNLEHHQFTEEDLAQFNRRREEYLKSPEIAVPWEEAMARLRNKIKG